MLTFIPDGIVRIFRNVGLTPDYNDTYSMVSKEWQENFFSNKLVEETDKFTLARSTIGGGGVIKFPYNGYQLYECDYMAFRNSGIRKWFYAFITDITYINPNVAEISYQLDILQTWYFDFVFPPMFIEREHVNVDYPGSNLMDEGLETGEFIVQSRAQAGISGNNVYNVWCTINESGTAAVGTVYGGIFSGLNKLTFSNAEALKTFIVNTVADGKGDGIIAITMTPAEFDSKGSISPKIVYYEDTIPFPVNLPAASIDGYHPHNQKLYCYPYHFLKVSNNQGGAGVFRYEYFNYKSQGDQTKFKFAIAMDDTPCPTASCSPMAYQGYSVKSEYVGDMDQQITLNSYPLCAWASNTYAAWLAQNSNTLAWQQDSIEINTVQAIANSTIGGLTSVQGKQYGSAIGNFALDTANTLVDAYQQQKSLMATKQDRSILPPQASGVNSGYLQTALGKQDFYFYEMSITAEFARSIDAFFDMYGYAINQVKTPNFVGRRAWNYVKTQGAKVSGEAPSPACAAMEAILNHGVRFWHGDWIGEYNRDNSIIATSTKSHDMVRLTGGGTINDAQNT